MPRKNHTPPRSIAERASAIKKYDHAISALADIRTIAELLEAIGTRTTAEPVDAKVVSMRVYGHSRQEHLRAAVDKLKFGLNSC